MKNRLATLNATPVIVLSTGYVPLFQTSWQRAISAIYTGRAEIIEEDEELWIGTNAGKHPFPKKIRFTSGVYIGKLRDFNRFPRPSKKNLWYRDLGTCQYCSRKINIKECTIDHVVPKSKGGKHMWSNIVLSCSKCNQKKGSQMLKDSGMTLLNQPSVPNWFNFNPIVL